MKVEKRGNNYRVRKMYKGTMYYLSFDHEPDEKEITILLAEKYKEQGVLTGSFSLYAKKYIENRENVVSPNTIRTYKIKLKQLSDGFKNMSIQKITSEDVQAEINRLSETLEPKTVKTTYGFISSVLGVNRPFLKLTVKLPQTIKKDRYEPSNHDIERILDEVADTPYSIAFQLGVWGCREGEIAALTMDDLVGNNLHIHRTVALDDKNNRIIKESPKTDESNRVIPLSDQLVAEIKEQGFIYDKAPNRLNKKIHEVQKKLGIPPFPFHRLRSYFASYAHSLGIPDVDILSIGGWKTDNVMKQIYRKSIEESKEKSMQKLMDNLPKRKNTHKG